MNRTPLQRAEYRRRNGAKVRPYVPQAIIFRTAAIRREVETIKARARAMAKERARLSRSAAKPAPVYRDEQPAPSTPDRAHIRLTGVAAVGAQAFAIVDTDMVALLSRWKWKAKWNASHTTCYAVRNAKTGGVWITIRMHRVVAGLEKGDPWEPDHQNHNGLDNRRDNLVVGDRRANLLTRRKAA